MGAPGRIAMEVGEAGLRMFVRPHNRAEDMLYEAAQEAVTNHVSLEDFKHMCREAWNYALEEDNKSKTW